MASREVTKQRDQDNFKKFLKVYNFTDFIMDSPRHIQDKLNITAQEFRAMIIRATDDKLIYKTDHPSGKKEFAYYINLTEFEGNEIQDSGYRVCATKNDLGLLQQQRHKDHPEDTFCSRLDPSLWDLKTIYTPRQRSTNNTNKINSQNFSAPLKQYPRHSNTDTSLPSSVYAMSHEDYDQYLTALQEKNGYVDPNNLPTDRGRQLLAHINKPKPKKWNKYQRRDAGQELLPHFDETTKTISTEWVNKRNETIHDEYGQVKGVWNRPQNLFERLVQRLIIDPREENKRIRAHAKQLHKYRKELRKEYENHIRYESKLAMKIPGYRPQYNRSLIPPTNSGN